MNKRTKGTEMEQLAAEFLVQNDCSIICSNYRCRLGEIDIIARDEKDKSIVFVEVKYRSSNNFGTPFEAVDFRKQTKIRNTAMYFMKEKRLSMESKVRFDVIGIMPYNGDSGYDIKLIKGAF